MANYGGGGQYYDQGQPEWSSDSFNYNMDSPNFGAEQDFGSFDYSANAPTPSYGNQPQQPYSGNIFTPEANPPTASYYNNNNTDFEDEPPLLEELGINFDHIIQRTLAVLNPFKAAEASILQETDLAGPLVFCLAFGALLLLSGKVHFGYIYGIGVLGCLGLYVLLNLMSAQGISSGCTISVLGYCILPMVALSGVSVLVSLTGMLGTGLSLLAVAWCALSASKIFVTALAMDHQQPLVAYPCALIYGVFALLTMF